MLLYNAEVPPFVAPGDYVALDGCGLSPVRCHGWPWPKWNPPDRRSPTAITLLILPSYGSHLPRSLSRNSISAKIVNRYASPLECIFCPGRLIGTSETCGEETGYPISAIKPKNQIPQWAATLLAAVEVQAESEEAQTTSGVQAFLDDDRWDARYSIVLPYIG
jgi:hypothetical protein